MNPKNPKRIYLFSGKRKSGKDFVTDRLCERCNPQTAVVIKISAPIKNHWATVKGLRYDELLGTSDYKETYRKEMVEWSEAVRREDYGYFCRAAVDLYSAKDKSIWIVSDIRRKTDIKWFRENYGAAVKTVRITCDEETRKERGWVYTEGIDNEETECDLDGVTEWDEIVENSGCSDLSHVLAHFLEDIKTVLH